MTLVLKPIKLSKAGNNFRWTVIGTSSNIDFREKCLSVISTSQLVIGTKICFNKKYFGVRCTLIIFKMTASSATIIVNALIGLRLYHQLWGAYNTEALFPKIYIWTSPDNGSSKVISSFWQFYWLQNGQVRKGMSLFWIWRHKLLKCMHECFQRLNAM